MYQRDSGSRELLQSANQLRDKSRTTGMAETRVAVDPCAENQICSSKRGHVTDSTMSLHSCTCGPECGPEKCGAGAPAQKTTLVSWDEMRTKMFLLLIAAFAVWLLIYVPISVINMQDDKKSG